MRKVEQNFHWPRSKHKKQACIYAGATGRRSVGIPDEMERHFSIKPGQASGMGLKNKKRNGSHYFYSFYKFPTKVKSTAMNRFVKIMQGNGKFRSEYFDRNIRRNHLRRWFLIFRSEGTETDLSIWLLTEISGIFGIMESTLDFPFQLPSKTIWRNEDLVPVSINICFFKTRLLARIP